MYTIPVYCIFSHCHAPCPDPWPGTRFQHLDVDTLSKLRQAVDCTCKRPVKFGDSSILTLAFFSQCTPRASARDTVQGNYNHNIFNLNLESITMSTPPSLRQMYTTGLCPSCLASCHPWAQSSSQVALAWRPHCATQAIRSICSRYSRWLDNDWNCQASEALVPFFVRLPAHAWFDQRFGVRLAQQECHSLHEQPAKCPNIS